MQDGSRNKSLPTSKLLREPSAGRALEGNGGMFSEASSDGELCMDSGTELDCGDGDFADLNAFLSADEINRSLDLAREAFTNVCEPEDPGWARLTDKPELLAGQAPSSVEKPVCHKPAKPVYNRAATFIEELSSIFKGSAHVEQQVEEESSSPDSGYLSPRNQRGSASVPSLPPGQRDQAQSSQSEVSPHSAGPAVDAASDGDQHSAASATFGPLSPPQFLQKLKSQEIAEGSPIRLECRVGGNPPPLVRWFCEGRELQNSPDIQISKDGDLHTLVIAEAFEDDTGRYTCVASNSLGAENTSAEVYIEGQITDPRSPFCSRDTQSPVLQGADVSGSPVFTKHLQDAQASEGQVVVLECRVRGSPPLQVRWYREGNEILDSPDFRILQKSEQEICTLVIAEAFPEDGGLFCCTASNPCGSVSSSARLTVTPAEDSSSNGMSGDSSGFEDAVSFPPPPPPTEITHLELPPKALPAPGSEAFHIEELEVWPSVSSPPPVPITLDAQEKQNGHHPSPPPSKETTPPPPPPPPLPHTDMDDPAKPQSPALMTPGSPPTPGKLSPSSGRDAPPLPTRPKPKL
uniref:Ig-like domain-containing protein n=1 Tax=Oryzias melastigma TaxID=30732 RepID=A0A3B3DNI4_ORYME